MILKNDGDISNGTPLHAGSRTGNENAIRFLLDRGANINVMDEDRHTTIFEASKLGHKGTAELLIRAIGLNGQSADHDTSLGIAGGNCDDGIFQFLPQF
ncbi:hypothetical protein N7466_003788 [Penicillium verhagenii]|uniref:uncharacterized protein n=1 Tax=Penicillium verhagenii TaxID=1562060 RepID=UPI0025451369|nr:uncharacterized protein N7466_003788 [Penicillium verhagenii]KAJ5934241.1 hypothetical protein N7466_003788 [Penicillium verhagenii]